MANKRVFESHEIVLKITRHCSEQRAHRCPYCLFISNNCNSLWASPQKRGFFLGFGIVESLVVHKLLILVQVCHRVWCRFKMFYSVQYKTSPKQHKYCLYGKKRGLWHRLFRLHFKVFHVVHLRIQEMKLLPLEKLQNVTKMIHWVFEELFLGSLNLPTKSMQLTQKCYVIHGH